MVHDGRLLKTNEFNLWNPVQTTLRFTFDGRQLSLISNSMVSTLFNAKTGVPTSAAYLFAVICAGLIATSFLLTGFLRSRKIHLSQALFFIAFALVFGSIGTTTNLFFSGRLTQVFSIFSFFGLIFTSIYFEKFYARIANYTFWSIVFSFSYSARYILLCSFVIFFLETNHQYTRKKNGEHSRIFRSSLLATIVSSAISLTFSIGEIRNITNLILSDRGSDYGLFGKSIPQNLLVWTGYISTWTDLASISKRMILTLIACQIMILLIIVYRFLVLKTNVGNREFTGIYLVTLFLIISCSMLGVANSFFLIYKMSTYLPYLTLIALSCIFFEIRKFQRKYFGSLVLALGAVLYISSYLQVLPLQISTYRELISSRNSSISYELLQVRDIIEKSKSTKVIYGFISDPESQLLTRAVFKDFDWQPLNSIDYDYTSEIVPKPRNDSKFDWLIVRKNIECQLIDFDSNKSIYANREIYLYSDKSSFVEFGDGMKLSYSSSENIRCLNKRFEYRTILDEGSFRFVNGSQSRYVQLEFQLDGKQSCEQISIFQGVLIWVPQETERSDQCLIKISGNKLELNRILEFKIQNNSELPIALTKISWEKL